MTESVNKMDIYGETVKLLKELFDIDPITVSPQSRLIEDLDLDSIDAVDMVVYLQKKIGKRIKPEDFQSVETIQDIVNVLQKLVDGDVSEA